MPYVKASKESRELNLCLQVIFHLWAIFGLSCSRSCGIVACGSVGGRLGFAESLRKSRRKSLIHGLRSPAVRFICRCGAGSVSDFRRLKLPDHLRIVSWVNKRWRICCSKVKRRRSHRIIMDILITCRVQRSLLDTQLLCGKWWGCSGHQNWLVELVKIFIPIFMLVKLSICMQRTTRQATGRILWLRYKAFCSWHSNLRRT